MAKSTQTFKKRQREQKLREKAQLKRERREQRSLERKSTPPDAVAFTEDASAAGNEASTQETHGGGL